jgi:hypothetical protein
MERIDPKQIKEAEINEWSHTGFYRLLGVLNKFFPKYLHERDV